MKSCFTPLLPIFQKLALIFQKLQVTDTNPVVQDPAGVNLPLGTLLHSFFNAYRV